MGVIDLAVVVEGAAAGGGAVDADVLVIVGRVGSGDVAQIDLVLTAAHLDQPRDGRYIFISGPGYGWKQWVSDGFYTALGLDDPEKTTEANRADFWNPTVLRRVATDGSTRFPQLVDFHRAPCYVT